VRSSCRGRGSAHTHGAPANNKHEQRDRDDREHLRERWNPILRATAAPAAVTPAAGTAKGSAVVGNCERRGYCDRGVREKAWARKLHCERSLEDDTGPIIPAPAHEGARA
jgi:hypothetical protein